MKRIHLLRFDGDPSQLGPLVDALRADGGRTGWLDLALADPVPPSLVVPASLDFLRAVAIGEQLTVAVKPMRGAPVQRDLLREHFRGCRVVLVAGEVDAPALTVEGDGWRVGERGYTTDELVATLRKPSPFS